MEYDATRRAAAEFLGTAFLLATVIGSGIMAENLAGGNDAVALLCNTIPTGAILYVLITMFGPISGAHFNPAVSLAFALRGDIGKGEALVFTLAQVAGGLVGMVAAHAMFPDEALIQISQTVRTGPPFWFAEGVATFGLVFAILVALRSRPGAVPAVVALYITAAYWFTASTSFANPAVTIARSFTDTFSGIRPMDAPMYILAQLLGAVIALGVAQWLLKQSATQAKAKAAE